MQKLILASSSPFRRELLARLGLPFEAVSPDLDERALGAGITDPPQLARALAQDKAQSVLRTHPDAVVIGSDQVAHCQGQILGKPLTLDKAKVQLNLLSGKAHELVTAVCICWGDQKIQWVEYNQLTMKPLTQGQIKNYLQRDNPLQCAGSYRIESYGMALFECIETEDYTSMIGLPLLTLSKHLNTLGFKSFQS